jgi:isoquinoline 1-oxidoreductase beta subunit
MDTTRRDFLTGWGAAAGSLVVGFGTSPAAQGQTASPGKWPPMPPIAMQRIEGGPEVNAWVVVQPDDRVIVRIARSEMGQGTLTGLAQLVCEELECDWSKVTTEYPTPGQNLARNRVWGNFATGGSRGIRESHDYVRKAGAVARTLLVQAAAQSWGVSATECEAAQSVITHRPTGRTTTFGKVAAAAAALPVPSEVTLKDPKEWKLAGKRMARLDTVDKTTGAQVFGMDLKLPGMLCAAIRACPVFGGQLKGFDAAALAKRRGVRHVVQVGNNAVAVVADTWWQARTAVEALPIEWDLGPNAQANSKEFLAQLQAGLSADKAAVGLSQGQALATLESSARVVESTYGYPHQHHATMEVMNATARWTPQRCEVWTPTQNGEAALAATAAASGLPIGQCEVYKLHLGGGFGRRGQTDWVRQAVLIAKEVPGVPIKLIWSREEDMTHGAYHPVTQCKLRGGLDAQGRLTSLHMRISGQSIIAGLAPQNLRDGKDPAVFQGMNVGGTEGSFGYDIADLLIDHAMRNPHVPPGFWRGVNLNQNTLYLECFMDELAFAARRDPLAFRRELLAKSPRHLAVLNAAAAKAGWGTPAPKVAGLDVHRGLAVAHGFGSFVAACAEVSVSPTGSLKMHRIVAAVDCGHAVNPQQIEAQVEGSFAFGLSAALFGTITTRNGAVEQKNFDTYPPVRMAHMPKVETVVMPSGGFWGGVGEPTIAVAAPAVLNAIFAATGRRIRQMPVGTQSLRRA